VTKEGISEPGANGGEPTGAPGCPPGKLQIGQNVMLCCRRSQDCNIGSMSDDIRTHNLRTQTALALNSLAQFRQN
jgi:hypothetical protein